MRTLKSFFHLALPVSAILLTTTELRADTITQSQVQDGGVFTSSSTALIIGNPSSPAVLTLKNNAIGNISSFVSAIGVNPDYLYGGVEVLSGSQLHSVGSTFELGLGANTIGTVVVSGPGSQWRADSDLSLGNGNNPGDGKGVVTVNDGGILKTTKHLNISTNSKLTIDGGTASVNYLNSNGTIELQNGDLTITSYLSVRQSSFEIDGTSPTQLQLTNSAGGDGRSFTFGVDNSGHFELNEQTDFTLSNDLTLGKNAGSTGTVSISNQNTRLTIDGTAHIGDAGTGTIDINGGIFNPSTAILGETENSNGSVTIGDKSGFNGRSATVGGAGKGEITATDGSTISVYYLTLGDQSTGNGHVSVDGPDASLNANTSLIVGEQGTGSIEATNGATLSTRQTTIAEGIGSTGTIHIDGHSSWTNDVTLMVGDQGDGNLEVTDKSTLSAGTLIVGNTAKGIGNVTASDSSISGGHVTAGNEGQGFLDIKNGGNADISGLTVGAQKGSTGVVNIEDQSTLKSQGIVVGQNGNGELNLEGTINGVGGYLNVGLKAGSIGVVNINHGYLLFDQGNISVGNDGVGSVNITNGGQLKTFMIGIGFSNRTKGEGSITIAGDHSSIVASQIDFGDGNGTVTVKDGSQVTGQMNLSGGSFNLSASHLVTIQGAGTSWNGSVFMGRLGDNTLSILDGATLSGSGYSQIQSNFSGNTKIVVSGEDSRWSASTLEVFGFTPGVRSTTTQLIIENGGILELDNRNGLQLSGDVVLSGNGGTIIGNVTSRGIVSPGSSPGILTIDGNYTQSIEPTSAYYGIGTLQIELAGLNQGVTYDYLHVTGLTTLDGLLDLSFLDGFEHSILSTDTFTVLTSDGGLTGEFSNVGNDHRLDTRWGSFLVTYDAHSVVLSDFVAVPETSSLLLTGLGAAIGVGIAYRRRRSLT